MANAVTLQLSKGWILYGPPFTIVRSPSVTNYAQAMVRPIDNSSANEAWKKYESIVNLGV